MMSDYEVARPNEASYEFYVKFHGPKETHYEGGVWLLYIGLPSDYPFKSPSVGFRNKIFHPNVDWSSGTICLDVLNSKWTPVYDLVNVLDQLLPQLLRYPNPSDPLNGEAAMLCLRQPERYRHRIGSVIEEFANEAAVQSIMKNDLGLSLGGGPGPDRLELPPAASAAVGASRRSVGRRVESRRADEGESAADAGADADADADVDGRASGGNVSLSTQTGRAGAGGGAGAAAADGSGEDESSEASLSDDDGDSDISELSDY